MQKVPEAGIARGEAAGVDGLANESASVGGGVFECPVTTVYWLLCLSSQVF